jgi:phage gpG-like protein
MTPIAYGFRTGPRAELNTRGLDTTTDMLGEIGDRAEDMRPAMLVVRELLVAGNKKVFESRGGAIGTPWPDLASSTVARKARSGIPSLSSVMVETGDLQESLSGGKGARSRVTRSMVSAGTSLFYAVFHMAGSRGGKVPARPPIGIPETERQESLTIMERYLLRGAT